MPTHEEMVTEALRLGWIESPATTRDRDRAALGWPRASAAATDRARTRSGTRASRQRGRMEAPGAAIVAACVDGSWSLLDAVEDLDVPPGLAEAFEAHPGPAAHREAFPRPVRLGVAVNRAGEAPRDRARREEETATLTARGERADQWRPEGAQPSGSPKGCLQEKCARPARRAAAPSRQTVSHGHGAPRRRPGTNVWAVGNGGVRP